ncbi:MAG: glycosyltransferase family 39 protein [Cyanobacteria bacterium]|nr:glycosyltransferase family 39 protein [Cyanobacteriota bacterium]MDA0865002.1 glycosyltransferase family 39 protein [Cyanobacteriota bacterium]
MGRPLATPILIALLLGIGLRCWGLDHKLFWVDEIFTTLDIAGYTDGEMLALFHPPRLTTAQGLIDTVALNDDRPFGAMLNSLITENTNHVPLYYSLTYGWVKLLGQSVTALRALAMVCSLAALPLFYSLGRMLFNSRICAGLAVALMAVSPVHVLYSQEARPYSLWMLMTVLSSWALVQALTGHRLTGQLGHAPSRRWMAWALYGVTVSLGFYTHLYMPLVFVTHGLYVGFCYRWRWCPPVQRYLIASVAGVASFVPWLLAIAPYRHVLKENAHWQLQAASSDPLLLVYHLGLTLARGFIDFDLNYGFSPDHWWPYGVVIMAVAGLVAYCLILFSRYTPGSAWLLPVLLLLVPALGIVAIEVGLGQQQTGIPRYFTPCYVGAELVVAGALGQQIEAGASRLWSLVAISLLAIGALSCGNSALAETWWTKSGHYLPVVAEIINQSDRPFVVADSDAWTFALAYQLAPDTPMALFNSDQITPLVPPGYSDYFLYNAPTDWVPEFQAASGYTVVPLEGLENVPLWRVIP